MLHYTCRHELLPIVEAALVADRYYIEAPRHVSVDGTAALVLAQGATLVLLSDNPHQDMADIEVYGAAQFMVMQLFESLPFDLHKQPCLTSRQSR